MYNGKVKYGKKVFTRDWGGFCVLHKTNRNTRCESAVAQDMTSSVSYTGCGWLMFTDARHVLCGPKGRLILLNFSRACWLLTSKSRDKKSEHYLNIIYWTFKFSPCFVKNWNGNITVVCVVIHFIWIVVITRFAQRVFFCVSSSQMSNSRSSWRSWPLNRRRPKGRKATLVHTLFLWWNKDHSDDALWRHLLSV